MSFSPEAADLWKAIYDDLSEQKSGLFGAVTGRAEAQTVRLALLYALLDGATEISLQHLEAGLALWRYCENSARYIFGDSLDETPDAILSYLRAVDRVVPLGPISATNCSTGTKQVPRSNARWMSWLGYRSPGQSVNRPEADRPNGGSHAESS